MFTRMQIFAATANKELGTYWTEKEVWFHGGLAVVAWKSVKFVFSLLLLLLSDKGLHCFLRPNFSADRTVNLIASSLPMPDPIKNTIKVKSRPTFLTTNSHSPASFKPILTNRTFLLPPNPILHLLLQFQFKQRLRNGTFPSSFRVRIFSLHDIGQLVVRILSLPDNRLFRADF